MTTLRRFLKSRPTSKFEHVLCSLAKPLQPRLLGVEDQKALETALALFKSGWYFRSYPELARSGLTPLADYVLFGAAEGRDPHPLFRTSFYLERNPDVRAAGVNPLIHYLQIGYREGRDPHPLFSTGFYLQKHSEVAASQINPLVHYLQFGPADSLQPHPLFDTAFYYATQPDVKTSGEDALIHYLAKGSIEGRAPNPNFDPLYYRRVHPDVAAAGIEPLEHYAIWGRFEKRSIRTPRFESGVNENYFRRPGAALSDPDVEGERYNAFRFAIASERIRNSGLSVNLSFLNSDEPAISKYVSGLERQAPGVWLRLTDAPDSHVSFSCEQPEYRFAVTLHSVAEYSLLLGLLRSAGVQRLHLHQARNVPIAFNQLTADLSVPYDVTLHDSYLLCPALDKSPECSVFCAQSIGSGCTNCVATAVEMSMPLDVPSWRMVNGDLLAGAERVTSPSLAIAHQFERCYPWLAVAPAVSRSHRRGSKKRVLALLSAFNERQLQAGAYIRVLQPLTHPGIATEIDLCPTDLKTCLTVNSDAVIVQRTAVPDHEQAMRLIEHCARNKVRLIYETDDDLFHLPEDHPEAESYGNSIETAKLIAQNADAITVSTEPLRRELSRFAKPVFVIPNWLDERLWQGESRSQPSRTGNSVRALYAGSVSHLPDLALLEEPVRRLQREFDFELNIVGITNQDGPDPWFRSIPVHWRSSRSYLHFVAWLKSAGAWDFGLAPLLAGPFSGSKSAIKVYEYAALGLPVLASSVQPYESVVCENETGLLVRNTVEDWYAALRRLCESPQLLERLSVNAQSKVLSYTLKANAAAVAKSWRHALFGEPQSALSGSTGV